MTLGTGSLEITDYLDGFQYLQAASANLAVPTLQFFPTPEGYVNFDAGVFKYVYNYTDHLGNVRLSYTKNNTTGLATILDESHYYPFGLKHTKYNVNTLKVRGATVVPSIASLPKNKRLFNGKELQDELGLNFYDYGARNYMADIGRWGNIDPLAEVGRRWSPYNYAYNSPLRFTDPDGMRPGDTTKKSKKEKEDEEDEDWKANTDYLASTLGSSSNWNSETSNYGSYGKAGVGIPAEKTEQDESSSSSVSVGDPEIVEDEPPVSGLNHAMHQMDGEDGIDPPSKKKGMLENAKEKISEGIEFVKDFSGGVSDFVETYNEMKDANWKNSDKYFHSKANFKASLRGPGGRYAAEKMSNLREITDQRIKGDSRASSVADQRANSYGRQQAQKLPSFHSFTFSYGFVLDQYRPISLPAKY